MSKTGIEAFQANINAEESPHKTKVGREGNLRRCELVKRIYTALGFILDDGIFYRTVCLCNVVVDLADQFLGILGFFRYGY